MIAISALCCILCFKWRFLTNWFMYLECLQRIAIGCIPNALSQGYDVLQYTNVSAMTFLCLFNDSVGHFLAATVLQLFNVSFVMHVAYLKPATTMAVF